MSYFCAMCSKKMGFFDSFHMPADVLICDNCYSLYENVLDHIYDAEIFKQKIEEFKATFKSNENTVKIVEHLNEMHEIKLKEKVSTQLKENEINNNIGPFKNQDLIYRIDGVRGRHIDVYVDKVVITTKITIGSILTNNATDGEKTIYYADCIGVQFKQSKFAIGYLQLETASSNGNNKHSNFWNENSFTFDTSVISNERMIEVVNYIKLRIDTIKRQGNVSVTVDNNVSVADELLKLKQLLDMGVLSQEEFNEQKDKLLNK